jgi:hypothetical protein
MRRGRVGGGVAGGRCHGVPPAQKEHAGGVASAHRRDRVCVPARCQRRRAVFVAGCRIRPSRWRNLPRAPQPAGVGAADEEMPDGESPPRVRRASVIETDNGRRSSPTNLMRQPRRVAALRPRHCGRANGRSHIVLLIHTLGTLADRRTAAAMRGTDAAAGASGVARLMPPHACLCVREPSSASVVPRYPRDQFGGIERTRRRRVYLSRAQAAPGRW